MKTEETANFTLNLACLRSAKYTTQERIDFGIELYHINIIDSWLT